MRDTSKPEQAPETALASWRGPIVSARAAQQRGVDTFVRGAVLGNAVYAVVGAEGIAAVASPSQGDRPTYLFWSHQAEADRWADVLTAAPRVVAVDLHGFLAITLPEMITHGALAGVDWTSEPIEAELEPVALAAHLRDELARDFAFQACKTRLVFVLEMDGAIAPVMTPDGRTVTPVWANRHAADAALAAIGDPALSVARKPLLELTTRYLLSSEGLKAQIAPAYVHAASALQMSPWALKALLNGGGRPPARIAAVS
jgi:hypothetical protein